MVGCSLAAALMASGQRCTLASRNPPAESALAAGRFVGPLDGLAHRVVDAMDAHAVAQAAADATHVHLCIGLPYRAAVWRAQWPVVMRSAIAACVQHSARLVFFDNLYAYGPSPLQTPITESHPLAPPSAKGRVRLELLNLLHEAHAQHGLVYLIARSADFYGPGVRNSMLYVQAIERQLQGKTARVLFAPGKRHSYTYVPDAARAMALLALDDGAYGRAWHLPTSSEAVTTEALLAQSARLCGAPSALTPMPGWLLRMLSGVIGDLREIREMRYQYEDDYLFSSQAFEARYPALAVTPYARGLAATVAHEKRGRPGAG